MEIVRQQCVVRQQSVVRQQCVGRQESGCARRQASTRLTAALQATSPRRSLPCWRLTLCGSACVLLGLLLSAPAAADKPGTTPTDDASAPIDFAQQIQPILSSRCFRCHGADNPQAGLNLTGREPAIEAYAIVPGEPDESLLIDRVEDSDPDYRMPPEGEPLQADEQELLRRWIAGGAKWPMHWAYRPLQETAVPQPGAWAEAWIANPIDAFVAQTLQRKDLPPSPMADRYTLLRRASFDLRGLPPTREELKQFLEDDRPDAWERCIDRLLQSPAYGERWARHWMDLVHFAETHGHDQDRPREHAWPYRDYLIESFNEDKPYGRFVQEQIAGDVLWPDDPAAVVATGLLAAGPWDESSLRDIREDSLDRVIGQYLDRDDIVTTVMSTFASTSVHCARCHDHKFDPIAQREYYGLQAVFAGIDKANRPYDPDPQVARRRQKFEQALAQLEATLRDDPHALLSAEAMRELAAWEKQQEQTGVQWRPLVDLQARSMAGATLAERDAGVWEVSGGRPEKDIYVLTGEWLQDRLTAIRLELLPADALPQRGPGRADNGNLHLNEFRAFYGTSEDLTQRFEVKWDAPLSDFDQEGWTIADAVDGDPNTAWGIFPAIGQRHVGIFPIAVPPVFASDARTETSAAKSAHLRIELHQIHGGGHLIGAFRVLGTDAPKERLQQAETLPAEIEQLRAIPVRERSEDQLIQLVAFVKRRQLEAELAKLPPQQLVYSGTHRFEPEGSFRPASKPREVQVLRRGLIAEPLEPAQPAGLACLETLSPDFSEYDLSQEQARRQALAAWLADPGNPLTWRSIANRVWLYHIGRGLVDTPNDFGQMGASPTHPELLDFLATYLLQQGGSLKALHRLILTSRTYQQSSELRAEGQVVDAGNRWLWRMNRRRLDAESFRDAVLFASGTLDRTMGGRSVKQFIQTPGVHVTPVVDYQAFDVDAPANYRRSVYRFLFRTIPDPFMEALDCPDASQLTPQRNASLTAIQALATLNDKLLVRQSELLAESLERVTAVRSEQVREAYRRILAREPTAQELPVVATYVEEHGLANAIRFLFNTNAFLFVD